MKILVIHHVEPMWEQSFLLKPREYIRRLRNLVVNEAWDLTIQTSMEGDTYPELNDVVLVSHEWSYGWEDPTTYEKSSGFDPADIIPVGGHEYAYLYPWMKDLVGHEVHVCGGHRFECLRDLLDSFEYLGVDYTEIHELIY